MSSSQPRAIPHRSLGQGEPTLLFIHGFMDAGAVWDPVIAALDADVEKITIDLPGMGALHSDKGEISLARYAADVSGLIDYLARPVVIVAQSMGAQVAELVALANPTRVRGLVLLTPVPLAGVNAPPEAVAPFRQLGGEPALQRQARRNLSYALSSESEALLGGFGDVVTPATVSALVDAWNNGDPAGTTASAFTGPVLIIRGAGDPMVTSEMAGAIAGRFAHARTETVAEAGHWVHVEQPARVAALIGQYLKATEGRAIAAPGASDWTGAFEKRSATAFADAFAEDVVLEAAVLFQPVAGRENVKHVMEAASKIYESLEFTHQSATGLRQYLEWTARAFGGVAIDGVTIITRSEDGSISRVAIHHRPLAAALQFSAEIGQRLSGIIDSVHFLAVKDLPLSNRS